MSEVVYKYTCGRFNSTYYGETDRHLKVRSGEHTGISPLTFKKTKPSIYHFDKRNNIFVLEIKDSLLIKRDRPI